MTDTAEILRLSATVEQRNALIGQQSTAIQDLQAEIERLQRRIYTLEGMLGEMNIAMPECAALERK